MKRVSDDELRHMAQEQRPDGRATQRSSMARELLALRVVAEKARGVRVEPFCNCALGSIAVPCSYCELGRALAALDKVTDV